MAAEPIRIELSPAGRRELARALRAARVARVYRRLKAVQVVADGYRLGQAARLSDVGRTSVYRLLRAFARGGPAALGDAPRSGRPRKLPPPYAGDREGHDAWQRLLDRRPSTIPELATPSHVWTLRLPARCMAVAHRVEVAEATIDTALSRAGFRRGRTKLAVTSPDPQDEAKRRRIEDLGKGPGRGR